MNIRRIKRARLNFLYLISSCLRPDRLRPLQRPRWEILALLLATIFHTSAVWAGNGRCIWDHLPQAKRSQLSILEDYDIYNHPEAMLDAFSKTEVAGAAKACGVASNASDDILGAALDAGVGWGLQERSERKLFSEAHIRSEVLDAGWQHMGPALKSYLTSPSEAKVDDEKANSDIRDRMYAALGFASKPSEDAKDAIILYLNARSIRDKFEPQF